MLELYYEKIDDVEELCLNDEEGFDSFDDIGSKRNIVKKDEWRFVFVLGKDYTCIYSHSETKKWHFFKIKREKKRKGQKTNIVNLAHT